MRRCLVLLGLLVCSGAFAQAPIPLEQFTRSDEFGEPKISPDGAFLALPSGDGSALLFLDRQAQKVAAAVRLTTGDEIDRFDWISPTRILYTVARGRMALTGPIRVGDLYAIDRDGGAPERLHAARAGNGPAELLSLLHDDPDHVLMLERPWRIGLYTIQLAPAARPFVVRLDVYTGKRKTLDTVPLAGATVLVDRNEQVRLALGRNEQSQLVLGWKPLPDRPWQEIDLGGLRQESVQLQRFSADNRSVFFTAARAGESLARLFRMELKTRGISEVAALDGIAVTGVVTDFAGREIVGIKGHADRPVYRWLLPDDPAAKLYLSLQKVFAPQTVAITGVSQDASLAIAFVCSDTNPGDYYLVETATRHAVLLRSVRDWIDPRKMRPMEPFELSARDGRILHGFVTRPAGDGPHALVVLPHDGWLGSRNVWRFDPEVQLLASRGYAVLQVNHRGSGGYGVDFEQAGAQQFGRATQDDVTDATRWAIEQKIADPQRICIYGSGSYGGYAAVMGAVREPQLYRCAISYGGTYDLEAMKDRYSLTLAGRSYVERSLGSDESALRANSPLAGVRSIGIPVLLIHGEQDVFYDRALRMKNALEKQHKKVDWLSLRPEPARAHDEGTRRVVYERILAFLDANLRANLRTSPQASLQEQPRPGTP